MRRADRQITDVKEISEILQGCKVCHLAMTDQGMPYVVPLNFGYVMEGEILTLYFHSAWEGKKTEILRENNAVCFSMCREGELVKVVNPCQSGYYYESVIGFGDIVFVNDIEEKCHALTLLMKHQTGQDFTFNDKQAASVCVYKVATGNFTGKRKPRPENGQ